MTKWLLAVAGFFFYRFPGAVLGFIIGSILDSTMSKGGGSVFTNATREGKVSPSDFELNLLSLASIVIKADGSVSQTELDYVRKYFVQAYGKERANATFKTFNDVVKNREVSAERICSYLNSRTRPEVRLQILHFLFGIAKADGSISALEMAQLHTIANYLRISTNGFNSIKAMFVKDANNAYKILEIDKTATDAEVKKAFRTMVKKYHPDKLQHMDEAYQKGAREKFQKVQESYETIQQERGF